MNTVIFGGSFNPVHKGHKEMLTAAAELPFVDRILVLPDAIPPHKEVGTDFASAEHRMNMCKILADSEEKAEVCDLEIKRGGKSYMIDTVKELKKLYPDDKFYLLVGGDMAITLDKWYKSEELLSSVGILAIGRNTVEENKLNESADRLKARGTEVYIIPFKTTAISSTEVREAIEKGVIEKRIPEKIYEYIKQNGLYKKGERNAER